MPTQHPLSPCCRAFSRRHGDRRRQCTKCEKTWRIFIHKRGRNPKRRNPGLVKRVVFDQKSLSGETCHFPELKAKAITKRFERSLKATVAKPRKYPRFSGRYILLADGIWYSFDDEDWVLFIFVLKPRRRNYGYLFDPVLLKGKESFDNWTDAIDTIPSEVRKRIFAFVSDNFRCSRTVANRYGWLHQLCHAHLILDLQKRRGGYKNFKNRSIREGIYQFICRLLVTRDQREGRACRRIIETLAEHHDCPKKLRMMANEFLRKLADYRTYATHPTLTIPRTNNVSESLVNLVRKRTGKLNRPEAVRQWATAFIRMKRRINCNGHQKKPPN